MSPSLRHALQAGLLLGLVALVAVGLLAAIAHLTAPRIAEAERAARLQALADVMPPGAWDNDPLSDRIQVLAPAWLGRGQPATVWRARRDGAPVQLVVEATAPRGYSGPIQLLVGVDRDRRVVGVRVLAHQETPGLGDGIERRRSDWIEAFNGRGLQDPPRSRWRVRRDGGDFDQFTGATITPRAVVAAVASALAFVEAHEPALYAAPAGSTLDFPDAPSDLPRR